MFKEFRPMPGFICGKIVPKQEKSSGGIYVPTDTQETFQKAEIVSYTLLDERFASILEHKYMFFKKYSGTMIYNDHIVLKIEDILGVIGEIS